MSERSSYSANSLRLSATLDKESAWSWVNSLMGIEFLLWRNWWSSFSSSSEASLGISRFRSKLQEKM